MKSHHDNMGFFNDNYHLGINWYRSFFPTIFTENKILREHGKFLSFDVTTRYMEDRSNAENIKKIKPEMKIITILRNPVDRAYSQFNLSSKEIDQPSDFETYISKEIIELNKKLKTNEKLEFTKQEQHYVQKGIYSIQLKPWFEIFPRENILILSTEDLEKNNASVYSEIFNFLDIPDCEIDAKRRIGKGEYLPMKNTTRQILSDFYKEHNEELFKLIGKRFEWIS